MQTSSYNDQALAQYQAQVDRQDDEAEAIEEMTAVASKEIEDVFCKDTRTTHPRKLTLPRAVYQSVMSKTGKVERYSLMDAIADMICDEPVVTALLNVLHASDCAEVQKLRQALATRYSELEAEEVGIVWAGV